MFLEWLPAVEGHGLKFFKKASSNRKGAVLFGDYHYIRQTEKGGGSVLEGCYYDRSYLRESEQDTLEKLCTGFEGKTRIDLRSGLRKFAKSRETLKTTIS